MEGGRCCLIGSGECVDGEFGFVPDSTYYVREDVATRLREQQMMLNLLI